MNSFQLFHRLQTITLTGALLLPLAACGSTPEAQEPAASPDARQAVQPRIVGQWNSPCMDLGGDSPQFARLDFDIDASDWSLDYLVHGDAECNVPLVTVSIEGPYEIGAASTSVEDAYDARFGFRSKTITPHVDGLKDALTNMSCGTEPWELDVAQSVLEGGCPGFGQYPVSECEADYDLVSVQNGTLQFGARPADNNMCSPDKRPTALAPFTLHGR